MGSARARLQELGRRPSWVERELPLKKGTIHLVLSRNRTSIYVDQISAFLGILPPVSEDAEVTQLVGLITQLWPENRNISRVLISALLDFQERSKK